MYEAMRINSGLRDHLITVVICDCSCAAAAAAAAAAGETAPPIHRINQPGVVVVVAVSSSRSVT